MIKTTKTGFDPTNCRIICPRNDFSCKLNSPLNIICGYAIAVQCSAMLVNCRSWMKWENCLRKLQTEQ